MVELVKILEERFMKQYGYDENNESQRVGLANYKKDRRNELTQLFKDLGLEDSLDMFKTVEGKVAKVYWFYEDEVAFVNRIYDEYSDPLIAVRKRQINDLSDEYAVKLYEDILKLFTRRGLSLEEAYKKTKITYNILEYPIRKKQLAISELKVQMEKITDLIMEERLRNITSRNDDLAWIEYVNRDLTEKVNQYLHLYGVMTELRQCDINDYAEQQYRNMTEEELEQMEIEEFVGLQVFTEWKALPRVRELEAKKREITGEPVDPSEMRLWVPRMDYTLQERKTLDIIETEMRELYSKTTIKVQKETIAGKDLQPFFEKQVEYGFKGLRTSEQLLEAALTEIEEEKEYLGVRRT